LAPTSRHDDRPVEPGPAAALGRHRVRDHGHRHLAAHRLRELLPRGLAEHDDGVERAVAPADLAPQARPVLPERRVLGRHQRGRAADPRHEQVERRPRADEHVRARRPQAPHELHVGPQRGPAAGPLAREEQRARHPAQQARDGTGRARPAVVGDRDGDARREREERLLARSPQAHDLDLVPPGERAGDVEHRADRAAHPPRVDDQDRDLRGGARGRAATRAQQRAHDQAGHAVASQRPRRRRHPARPGGGVRHGEAPSVGARVSAAARVPVKAPTG
jgi:hypothetical protein